MILVFFLDVDVDVDELTMTVIYLKTLKKHYSQYFKVFRNKVLAILFFLSKIHKTYIYLLIIFQHFN